MSWSSNEAKVSKRVSKGSPESNDMKMVSKRVCPKGVESILLIYSIASWEVKLKATQTKAARTKDLIKLLLFFHTTSFQFIPTFIRFNTPKTNKTSYI